MNQIRTLTEYHKAYNKLPRMNDPDYKRELAKMDLLSRFQILEIPLMSPGKCCVCGACKPDRKYIDIGISIDYFGCVYFCTYCVKEMAKVVLDLEDKTQDKIVEKIDYSESIEKLAKAINGMKEQILSLERDIVGSSFDAIVSDTSSADNDSVSDLSVSNKEGKESGSSDSSRAVKSSTRSGTGRGSKNLSSVEELLARTKSGK